MLKGLVLTTADDLSRLERPLGGEQQLVHVHGLQDKGVRAELQTRGPDGLQVQEADDVPTSLVHAAAEDDDDRIRVLVAEVLEQLEGAHVRQVEVGDDQRRPPASVHLEGFVPTGRQQAWVAGGKEDVVEDLPDQGGGRHDEDVVLRLVAHRS